MRNMTIALGLSLSIATGCASAGDGNAVNIERHDGAGHRLERVENLPPLERLSQSLSYKGMIGVAEVVVEGGGESFSVDSEGRVDDIWTRHRVQIQRLTRGRNLPYKQGDTVDMLVPGGKHNGFISEVEGQVNLSSDDVALVWIREDRIPGVGASDSNQIVVSTYNNVARVDDGIVQWAGGSVGYDDAWDALGP